MDRTTNHMQLTDVQAAADLVVEAGGDEAQGTAALEVFSTVILERFGEDVTSSLRTQLFSPELPLAAQRFSAVWLTWILSQNPLAFDFGEIRHLIATLCDRAIPGFYPPDITEKHQTFEKLQALEHSARSVLEEGSQLINRPLHLDRIEQFREDVLRFLNNNKNKLFWEQLLPWSLVSNETQDLFYTIVEYAKNRYAHTTNVYDTASSDLYGI